MPECGMVVSPEESLSVHVKASFFSLNARTDYHESTSSFDIKKEDFEIDDKSFNSFYIMTSKLFPCYNHNGYLLRSLILLLWSTIKVLSAVTD